MEQWRDIPGFGGRYQISTTGFVKSFYFGKKVRHVPVILTPYREKTGYWTVSLTAADGTSRKYYMHRLMAMTFLHMPFDYIAFLKNGIKSDWAIENVGIKPKKYRGYGQGRRRPVRKVCKATGEIMAFYGSVKEAAEKNYMSQDAVRKRCNNITRIETEEFTFQFDDWGNNAYGQK